MKLEFHPEAEEEIGTPLETDLRKLVLERFPYSLIYGQVPYTIYVLAVAHARRRPGYWQPRIDR